MASESESCEALRARSGAVSVEARTHARTRTRPRARLIAAIHYGEQSSDRRSLSPRDGQFD